MAAQTVAVAPTATWVAFQLEEAKRAAQQQTEQQNAFVSRLLDLAWISGLVILVVAGAIILGRQIAKNFSQTAQARATAATQVEQARAATERERQKAEKAKAFAAQAKPPIYIIEEKNATTASPFGSASTPSTPVMQSIHQHSITPHGDQDIQTIWEAPLLVEPEGSLEQTDTLVIDNSHQGRT
ncbi:MAG: hypothetical protein HC853_01090 [Anaerolineae bacterium]|nr:hypothetical protein [Anaerolineae bacterium]